MQTLMTKTALICLIFLGIPFAAQTQVSVDCLTTLPVALQEELKKSYPDARLLTLDMLIPKHRTMYLKENVGSCPGIAAANFTDTNTKSYALTLTAGDSAQQTAFLVLATPIKEKKWKLEVLETAERSFPVVFALPPGTYNDAYGERNLTAKHDAILLVGYESWAIVYAWTGDKFDKIWISD